MGDLGTLDAFYVDIYEVTVGEFKQFVEDSKYDWDGPWYLPVFLQGVVVAGCQSDR